MSRSHDHSHSHGLPKDGLSIAFLLNLSFTLIEIIGGLWTNSIAILADAVHDLGDSLTLGIVLLLKRKSEKSGDAAYTYGYQRFNVLGALISGVVLIVGIAFILWHAIPRLLAPEEVSAPGIIGLAILGVVMNGAAYLRVRRGASLSERLVSWHILEDVLGWVAVLVGGAAIYFGASPIIDPILSIGISLFVLWNVLQNLKTVMHVFLQRAPSTFDVEEFEAQVRSVARVESLHHTHIWTLDGEHHVLTTHVVMSSDATREDIVQVKERIRQLVANTPITHITVDVELADERCLHDNGPTGAECD